LVRQATLIKRFFERRSEKKGERFWQMLRGKEA
jgi:hypothetical protein